MVKIKDFIIDSKTLEWHVPPCPTQYPFAHIEDNLVNIKIYCTDTILVYKKYKPLTIIFKWLKMAFKLILNNFIQIYKENEGTINVWAC